MIIYFINTARLRNEIKVIIVEIDVSMYILFT
jgi:hypothetical protein